MAHGVQKVWGQHLRRTAVYTCLCFQLANSEVIAEGSWKFSELEWLRIYNAAVNDAPELLLVSWGDYGHGRHERRRPGLLEQVPSL